MGNDWPKHLASIRNVLLRTTVGDDDIVQIRRNAQVLPNLLSAFKKYRSKLNEKGVLLFHI